MLALALTLAASSAAPTPTCDDPPSAAPARPWRLELSHGGAAHGFGHALVSLGDLDGDGWDELAVSAPAAGLDEPGAVWVISGRSGNTRWTRTGESPRDEFGYALATIDWNRDGNLDLVVGARLATVRDAPRGRVTVLSGVDGKELARLEGSEALGGFGTAVANVGDVDGDGHPDLAIGAPGEERGAGQVHVHAGRSGALRLRVRGADEADQAGTSLAAYADANGDGHPDFLVGAPGTALRAPEAGAVNVLNGKTGRLLRPYWGFQRGERLGERVAVLGDLDGDGAIDFAVAAPGARLGADPDVGRVDVLSGRRGELMGSLRGTGPGDFFGRAIAGGFDWTGKGGLSFAIGAPYAANPAAADAVHPGAVFVYDGRTRELLFAVHGARSRDHFGSAIAVARTPEGPELWVGAPSRGETLPPVTARTAGFARAVAGPAK